jgi:ABC-type transport system involved in cytochrome c biogenesis permease component
MPTDYSLFLWLLKLGAIVNVYFLAKTLTPDMSSLDPHLLIPAQILFAVSGYRCLFPNRYEDNVVLHDSPLSSTLVTRVIATFSEVAYIYQFAHVLRLLNLDHVGWIDGLATLMVVQVVISQAFVWSAILTGRHTLYVYEEIGWGVIFLANTIASTFLLMTLEVDGGRLLLLELSLAFGAVYLPWQGIHLNALRTNAQKRDSTSNANNTPLDRSLIMDNLRRSFFERNRSTSAAAWGGWVGLTWMTAYWATLIPLWVYLVIHSFAAF